MSTFVYLIKLDELSNYYRTLCEICYKKYGYELDVRNINCALVQYGLYKEYGLEKEMVLCKSMKGFPVIQNSEIEISLSHGKKMIGCAISDSYVGLDIQEVITCKPEYADFLLSAYEKRLFNKSENKDLYFTIMWTLKEAYGKYLRVGLRYDFVNTQFNHELSVEHSIKDVIYKSEQFYESVISCVSKTTSFFYEVGIEELLLFLQKTS